MSTFTPEDLNYLAVTIWAEARGEGREGMELVASVIKNRVEAQRRKQFGLGYKGVTTHPWQFSCWNPNDPNRARCLALINGQRPSGADGRAYDTARQVAFAALSGLLPDKTGGASFYHTDAVNPSWNRNMRRVAQVGRHIFWVDD